MERKVSFTQWRDPLYDYDEDEEDANDFDESDYEWKMTKKMLLGNKKIKSKGNIFISPVGIFPLGNNLASSQNKLWVGHTTFQLSPQDKKTCLSVLGVEGWKELTPYRFLLMVGWMFNDKDVHKNLQDALCPKIIQKSLPNLLNVAVAGFPYWCQIKLKSGKNDLVQGKTIEEVENKLAQRKDFDIIVKKSWK